MTEAEWLDLTVGGPYRMLQLLRSESKPRKLRLFICACCRLYQHLLTDTRSLDAVEIAEQFADRVASGVLRP